MKLFSEEYSLSTVIATGVVILVILFLGFLFYYYATLPIPVSPVSVSPSVSTTPSAKPTQVILFTPPVPLPKTQKSGYCFASSVADPFRQDAFRCMVVNSIYDPCFTVNQKGFVYCQVGIDESTGFLMKLTKALPAPEIPVVRQDNWAWFLELADGTECSPLTGTRPFFGNNQVAYYDCKSNDSSQQLYLLGDLTKGTTWKAVEAVVTQNGSTWAIKSTKQVNIATVWQ